MSRAAPWIDVSRTLSPAAPVWPGDPPVEREHVARIRSGDASNVSRFCLSSHAGTHVDAPRHFLDDGAGVDALDVNVLCGPCRVLDLSHATGHIAARDLDAPGEVRLLIKTVNSLRDWDRFHDDYTALAPDVAEAMARAGVWLVGVDGPSVEAFHQGDFPVHHLLLGAGIILVENLDLRGITPGRYDMVCAPLKWADADGAPARVFLRRL